MNAQFGHLFAHVHRPVNFSFHSERSFQSVRRWLTRSYRVIRFDIAHNHWMTEAVWDIDTVCTAVEIMARIEEKLESAALNVPNVSRPGTFISRGWQWIPGSGHR
jgi:hypothetical protein